MTSGITVSSGVAVCTVVDSLSFNSEFECQHFTIRNLEREGLDLECARAILG